MIINESISKNDDCTNVSCSCSYLKIENNRGVFCSHPKAQNKYSVLIHPNCVEGFTEECRLLRNESIMCNGSICNIGQEKETISMVEYQKLNGILLKERMYFKIHSVKQALRSIISDLYFFGKMCNDNNVYILVGKWIDRLSDMRYRIHIEGEEQYVLNNLDILCSTIDAVYVFSEKWGNLFNSYHYDFENIRKLINEISDERKVLIKGECEK